MRKLEMNALALLPLLLALRRERAAEYDVCHMATSTGLGFTTIVGTLLRRALLACLATMVLAACGGGGDEIEVTRSDTNWVVIDRTTGTTSGYWVDLDVRAFSAASTVTWENTTTGGSGEAYIAGGCDTGFFASCQLMWGIDGIFLAIGDNVIRITASENSRNAGTVTTTITRLPNVHLTIASYSPPDRETDVALSSSITIAFNKEIDPSTINSEVGLFDYLGNRVWTRMSSSGPTVTLVPEAQLTPWSTYRVVVSDRVRDLAGNRLADPYYGQPDSFSWVFTAGE
jgi:Bacterial Ig-like domain